VLVAALGGLGVVPSNAVTAGHLGPYLGTPPELAAAGRRLGIPPAAMRRLEVRWGLPPGLHEPQAGFITAAYHDGHIFVGRTSHPVDALAYEYLHDVWAHLGEPQRAQISGLLNQYDAARRGALEPRFSRLIRADVRNGASPSSARLDELHSLACSRTRDDHLAPELRDYCEFVLPGREVTTKKY
jgi:hypothetical protein